jgi:hypothetical protein
MPSTPLLYPYLRPLIPRTSVRLSFHGMTFRRHLIQDCPLVRDSQECWYFIRAGPRVRVVHEN